MEIGPEIYAKLAIFPAMVEEPVMPRAPRATVMLLGTEQTVKVVQDHNLIVSEEHLTPQLVSAHVLLALDGLLQIALPALIQVPTVATVTALSMPTVKPAIALHHGVEPPVAHARSQLATAGPTDLSTLQVVRALVTVVGLEINVKHVLDKTVIVLEQLMVELTM